MASVGLRRAMANTVRRPSLSAQARCRRGSVLAIQASLACWRSVRLSGFFHNAHRAFLSALVAPVGAAAAVPRAAPRAVFQAWRR